MTRINLYLISSTRYIHPNQLYSIYFKLNWLISLVYIVYKIYLIYLDSWINCMSIIIIHWTEIRHKRWPQYYRCTYAPIGYRAIRETISLIIVLTLDKMVWCRKISTIVTNVYIVYTYIYNIWKHYFSVHIPH